MSSKTLTLAKQLINLESVTPSDGGCHDLMISRLEAIGFTVTRLPFAEVDNFWAQRGDQKPLFTFAGHTDVVPSGPVEAWNTPPFEATEIDGYLYGRGTADMKGSLASIIIACEAFIAEHPNHLGSIGFLITSDEEGPAKNGTVKVIEYLEENNIKMDYCLVGEPSSTKKLGDVIKNGRRGSLGCRLIVKGIQGHVAYPHLAANPIHQVAPILAELSTIEWDKGNDFFPATSFQISNINSGTGATNVIPGECEVIFNFRYSTETTHEKLQQQVEAILDKHQLDYIADWNLSGLPFLTAAGELVEAASEAIEAITGYKTELSTSGGTSDGRFIAPTGAQVVELGPINATIHQVNECVRSSDLDLLSKVYQRILNNLLT